MDDICGTLKSKIDGLKKQIDILKKNKEDLTQISSTSPTLPRPSTLPTPSTSTDIDLIEDCLFVLSDYYENNQKIPLYMSVNNIKNKGWNDEKKNLLKKILSFILSKKSNFLDFIVHLLQTKHKLDPNQTTIIVEKTKTKLKIFLQTLTDTIEHTTAILEGKNIKDIEVRPNTDKKLLSFPKFLKPLFGVGRYGAYEALLYELNTEGEGGDCSPEQYFSMLHTMGLIAIELCKNKDTKSGYISFEGFKSVVYQVQPSESYEVQTDASSEGGSTSRRRNHRRNHSRKSINRNKKSKKIRKIYTSKRRARRRNQNKSKNKSRK
jgi:hypothetical protein